MRSSSVNSTNVLLMYPEAAPWIVTTSFCADIGADGGGDLRVLGVYGVDRGDGVDGAFVGAGRDRRRDDEGVGELEYGSLLLVSLGVMSGSVPSA
jgi:hypothetical protein